MAIGGERKILCIHPTRFVIVLIAVVIDPTGLVTCQEEAVCPSLCLCDFDHFVVNCSSLGLFDIPVPGGELFSWTESLDFSSNLLEEITVDTLRAFPGLLGLSLANNGLHDIANGSFGLQGRRLYRLVLSGNKFTEVPVALSELHVLRELDLSWNSLWFLGSDSFNGLNMLESLNLDHNTLHAIDGTAFHRLTSLHKLSMTQNFVQEDPVRWFTKSPIHELYLSYNSLPLENEIRSWFGNSETAPLKILVLVHNGIETIGSKFQGLTNLQRLDIGRNIIKTITVENFSGLFNLNSLIINANLLEYIDKRSFRETVNIQRLSIDENQLLSLPRGLFSHTKRLSRLNAARNRLEDISAITDDYLPELTELYLYSNSIKNVGSYGFTNLPALSKLVAGGNVLTSIPNITNLSLLTILELGQNQIHFVPHGAFHGTTSLMEIYLNENQLERLDLEPFVELNNLEMLTLSQNPWWCDCHVEWMQDLMYAEVPPIWVDDIIDGVYCENPPELRDSALVDVTQEALVLRCPTLPDRNAILIVIGTWFGLVFLILARYWFRKLYRANKRKKVSRRNAKFHKRGPAHKQKNGFIAHHNRRFPSGHSDSYALITKNNDDDLQGGRINGADGDSSYERVEIAIVTTV